MSYGQEIKDSIEKAQKDGISNEKIRYVLLEDFQRYAKQTKIIFQYQYCDREENRLRGRVGHIAGFRVGTQCFKYIPANQIPQNKKPANNLERYYDFGRAGWRSFRINCFVVISSFWDTVSKTYVDTPEQAGLKRNPRNMNYRYKYQDIPDTEEEKKKRASVREKEEIKRSKQIQETAQKMAQSNSTHLQTIQKAFDQGLINQQQFISALDQIKTNTNPFLQEEEPITDIFLKGIGNFITKVKNSVANTINPNKRGAQVGEVRTWQNKQFKKQSDGSWKLVTKEKKSSEQTSSNSTKKEEVSEPMHHPHFNDSIYTPEKLGEFAKEAKDSDLQSFVEKYGHYDNLKHTIEFAKNELEKREKSKTNIFTHDNPKDSKTDEKDPKKEIEGTIKTKEGEYHPETGEGWEEDLSLGMSDDDKELLNTKVKSIKNAVFNIAKDNARKSLSIIGGGAGIGKTVAVRSELKKMGYKEIDLNDKDFDSEAFSGKGYVDIVGGNSSYTGFLKDLYKYRGNEDSKIVLNFDDSDGIMVKATSNSGDPKINNLFKVLGQDKEKRTVKLDDTTRREIAKAEKIDESEVPESFDIYSKLNFITNKDLMKNKEENENVAALARRAQTVNIETTPKESLYNMSKYLRSATINDKKIPFKEAKEYYDFVRDNVDLVRQKSVISGNFYADLADYKDLFHKESEEGTTKAKTWQEFAKNDMSSTIKKGNEIIDWANEQFDNDQISDEAFEEFQKGFGIMSGDGKYRSKSISILENLYGMIVGDNNKVVAIDQVRNKYVVSIVHSENGILFLKRSTVDDFQPGALCLPGGGLEEGENIKLGVVRELFEETNLCATNLYPAATIITDDKDVIYYYTCAVDLEKQTIILNEESATYIFMIEDEWMKADLMLDLKEHLQLIFNIDTPPFDKNSKDIKGNDLQQIEGQGDNVQKEIFEKGEIAARSRWEKLVNRKWDDALHDEEFLELVKNTNQEDRDSGELHLLSVDEKERLLKEGGFIQKDKEVESLEKGIKQSQGMTHLWKDGKLHMKRGDKWVEANIKAHVSHIKEAFSGGVKDIIHLDDTHTPRIKKERYAPLDSFMRYSIFTHKRSDKVDGDKNWNYKYDHINEKWSKNSNKGNRFPINAKSDLPPVKDLIHKRTEIDGELLDIYLNQNIEKGILNYQYNTDLANIDDYKKLHPTSNQIDNQSILGAANTLSWQNILSSISNKLLFTDYPEVTKDTAKLAQEWFNKYPEQIGSIPQTLLWITAKIVSGDGLTLQEVKQIVRTYQLNATNNLNPGSPWLNRKYVFTCLLGGEQMYGWALNVIIRTEGRELVKSFDLSDLLQDGMQENIEKGLLDEIQATQETLLQEEQLSEQDHNILCCMTDILKSYQLSENIVLKNVDEDEFNYLLEVNDVTIEKGLAKKGHYIYKRVVRNGTTYVQRYLVSDQHEQPQLKSEHALENTDQSYKFNPDTDLTYFKHLGVDINGGNKLVEKYKHFNDNFAGLDLRELVVDLKESIQDFAEKNSISLDMNKMKSTITFSPYNTTLSFKYTDKSNQDNDFEIVRYFEADKEKGSFVEHNHLELGKNLRGGGLSKEILKNFYKQYKKANVKKIALNASLNDKGIINGGNTWGLYGFKTTAFDLQQLILPDIKDSIGQERFVNKDKKIAVTQEFYDKVVKEVNEFQKLNAKDTLFPMLNIHEIDKDIALAALQKCEWYGELDLTNEQDRTTFEQKIDYIN